MTIEQVLGLEHPEELERLTDVELRAIFEPKFKITRPDMLEQREQHSTAQASPQKQQFFKKIDQLSNLGIDVSFLKKSKYAKR